MNLDNPDNPVQAIITDNDTFESLADEWSTLMKLSKRACVFMSWQWHYTWWQVYADHRDQLHIVTWRVRGRLVGILPLYLRYGMLPVNACLRFMGSGESQIDEVATEYSDLLAEEGMERSIAVLAGSYLASFKHWNCVELNCLLDNAALRQSLLTQNGVHLLERAAGQRYRIGLGGSESSYMDQLPQSRAKRIRRSQRVAMRDGGIRATPIDSPADFDRAFRELAELNHERQAHKSRKSVFASGRFRRFHHELCGRLHHTGAANVIRFHMNSTLLAVLYCFYDEQSCHYYQSGFARHGANRYMPLTLAHLIEMQRNRDAGRSYYDLMRGKPPCYKDELGCETMRMVNLTLYRTSVSRQFAVWYRAVRAVMAEHIKRQST